MSNAMDGPDGKDGVPKGALHLRARGIRRPVGSAVNWP
jgi:hypothetical protein